MAENKTKPTDLSVEDFINQVSDEQKRKDSLALLKLMKKATGKQPTMWGNTLIGFGSYHYKYKSGHEGDYFLTGFSPRKNDLTVYIITGFEKYADLMQQLGKYKTGKSCLYIKKLEDIDLSILEQLVKQSAAQMAKN